jgi:thioesterase domain-containing protein/acyl carrier protein
MSTSLSETSLRQTSPAAEHSAQEIRRWIVAEISKVLNVDPREIDPAAPLDSHGVDSVSAISITGKLSTWLDRDLPATLMWDCPSINAIAEKLAGESNAAKAPLPPGVIPMQPRGDRTPVFFFPGVGGHPVSFMAFAGHLGPSQRCYGLTVPGMDGVTEPYSRLEDMAAEMVRTLRLVQREGPYQLAGYSFGGLLAYESARQLTEAGEKVSMLAIYDTFAPGGRSPRPLWQRLALHAYLLIAKPNRLKYLRERIDRFRGIETDDDEDVLSELLSPVVESIEYRIQVIHDANLEAARRYNPAPYPGSALWFIASNRQQHNLFYKIKPSGGWDALCTGGVRVVTLYATHLTMLDVDHARSAAEWLKQFLK